MISYDMNSGDATDKVYWATTFGDAWISFIFLKKLDYNDDDNKNVLHLLCERKDIDFERNGDRLKKIIQKNIHLFFQENAQGQTPCEILKNNDAFSENYFDLSGVLEPYGEYQDTGAKWKEVWGRFLPTASDEIIQAAFNLNTALTLSCPNMEKNPPVHVDKTLFEIVDEKYKDRLIEQAVINLCGLISHGEDTESRVIEIEDALMGGSFEKDDPIGSLQALIKNVQQKHPDLNANDLKQVASHFKGRFASNKQADKAVELRTKALRATLLSLIFVGIPFAIYYWREFKKVSAESPVHVFTMPASTYSKISGKLTLEKDGSISIVDNLGENNSVFSREHDYLKRAVNIDEEDNTSPLFLADDIKAKTRLRIVCTDGAQTDSFKDKIDELGILDRFTVSTVL